MQTGRTHRRARVTAISVLVGIFVLGLAAIVALVVDDQPESVSAAGPCGTAHDGLDTQELEFLDHFRNWRASNNRQLADVQVSGALNAAAAWFAQHIVEHGPNGDGHTDHLGRRWAERAQDCGYPGVFQPFQYGSGEGTFYIVGGQRLNVSPYEAVYGGSIGTYQHNGVTYPGSGAWLSSASSNPAKCVGVGRYQSASGQSLAWIVLVAQYPASSPCPQSIASPPTTTPPTATPTATATPVTPTATTTATPTATPSPTSEPEPGEEWESYAPGLSVNR